MLQAVSSAKVACTSSGLCRPAPDRRNQPSPRCQSSTAVEVPTEFLARPCVKQNIARSRIETGHRPGRGEVGEIGYTTEIDDDAMAARVPEKGRMKRRHERSALSPRSDVAAAEIGDHGDVGELGKQGGVAELQGVSGSGAMPHRLAVAADGANGLRRNTLFLQQAIDGSSVERRELDPGEGGAVQLVLAWLVQGEQRGF